MADSTDSILRNLGSGRVDAAILRADVVAHAEQRGLLNSTFFKYVDAVSSLQQALSQTLFVWLSASVAVLCQCQRLHSKSMVCVSAAQEYKPAAKQAPEYILHILYVLPG